MSRPAVQTPINEYGTLVSRLIDDSQSLILPGTSVEERNWSERDTRDSIDTWAVGRGHRSTLDGPGCTLITPRTLPLIVPLSHCADGAIATLSGATALSLVR